jgi:hypothetical protein
MIYVKINDTLFPASISGRMNDHDWGGRSSKTIRLTMSAANAASLFINDVQWSIVEEYVDDQEQTTTVEYDNSEYCVAGDITDHRDGTVSVKMGKATDRELIEIMTGGNQ